MSRACLFGRYTIGTAGRNLLFLTIGIDIPFYKPAVSDDRYQQTFHHSIVSDDRYRYVDLSPFYCCSVGEQRRSKTDRLGTINSSSPLIIHAARPSSPAENPRIRGCLSFLWPRRWVVPTTRWWSLFMCVRCEAQVCSVLERPVCVPFNSFFYPG